MHRDRSDRVVDADTLQTDDRERHDHASDQTDDDRAHRTRSIGPGRDADEAGEDAVEREADIWLPDNDPRGEHRSDGAGTGGERRRDRRGRNVGSNRCERRPGVEAVPAEPQDEDTEGTERHRVTRDRPWACPLSSYLPILGPTTMTPASAATPPSMWTTPEPAKSV